MVIAVAATLVLVRIQNQTEQKYKHKLQLLQEVHTKKTIELKKSIEQSNKEIEDLKKQLQSKRSKAASDALLAAASVVAPKARAEAQTAPTQPTASLSRQEWLLKLRQCESGGNYAINTGNGFYGAYQFMISTWNNIASKTGRQHLVGVRPDLASPADQDAMIVDNTNMTMGLVTQNPGCYAKMGLSNKPPM